MEKLYEIVALQYVMNGWFLRKGENKIWKASRGTYPMASRVSAQVIREEAAAAFKLGRSHCKTLWSPAREVPMPTTPARREKMTNKPVAIFPKGK